MPVSSLAATAAYVKFVRGTPAGFANLATKNDDTLYFISETNAQTGKLYLGSKLISGSTDISSIGDIVINGATLADQNILVYDETSDAWVNSDIQSVIGIMQGASSNANGVSGLVPAPQAGDQNKFLRGDGEWETPLVPVESGVFTYNNNSELTIAGLDQASVGDLLQVSATGDLQWVDPGTLQTDLTAVNSAISGLQAVVDQITSSKLQREIVESIEDIDPTDTTKSNVIYMVPNEDSSNGNIYSEYMVIDGEIELIGSNYEGDLSGYVTTSYLTSVIGDINDQFDDYVTLNQYESEVGDLSQLITSQTNGDTLVDQINDLTDRLAWYLIRED